MLLSVKQPSHTDQNFLGEKDKMLLDTWTYHSQHTDAWREEERVKKMLLQQLSSDDSNNNNNFMSCAQAHKSSKFYMIDLYTY